MAHFSLIPAAYVVLRRNGKVLLQQRQNTGYRDGHWALLAGHVESGESAYAAAAREAYEEAGVSIVIEDLIALSTVHRTVAGAGPIEQRCDLFFEAHRWGGSPVIREPAKCAAMQWWDLEHLPEPLVPHEHTVLDWLRRGNRPPAIITDGF